MKIFSEARCPLAVSEENMTKKEIQARLAELGIEVTLRPRKSTLLKLLDNAERQATYTQAAEICKPKSQGVMATIILFFVWVFFGLIGLEIINYYTLDLPFNQLAGMIALFVMLIGIPVWILIMELRRVK